MKLKVRKVLCLDWSVAHSTINTCASRYWPWSVYSVMCWECCCMASVIQSVIPDFESTRVVRQRFWFQERFFVLLTKKTVVWALCITATFIGAGDLDMQKWRLHMSYRVPLMYNRICISRPPSRIKLQFMHKLHKLLLFYGKIIFSKQLLHCNYKITLPYIHGR